MNIHNLKKLALIFLKIYHFDEILIIIYKVCCAEKIDDSSQVWANINHVNVYTS
jgi:hypothetical protein